MITIRITQREHAHILAALRRWQKDIPEPEGGTRSNPGPSFGMIHFDEQAQPLNAVEIDTLCLKIYFGDPAKRQQ